MVYILLAVIYIVQQIFDINHQNLGVTSLPKNFKTKHTN